MLCPQERAQSSSFTPSLGPGGGLQAPGGLAGFPGALCAGRAVFTDGLLRNTRWLTHNRPVPRALWEVNVGVSQERLVG